MKSTSIYKTRRNYKIVTMYKTDTGTYVLREPIFIVPVSADKEELKSKIFESISASKVIPYPEDSFMKELLKKMKQPSYKKLYTNSTSCSVFLEKDKITIEPNMCKDPNQGLEPVVEDFQELKYSKGNELLITEKIIHVLEKEY